MSIAKPSRYYAAYGSNLHYKQMRARCPNARPLGVWLLNDWRLVFRGWADIEPAPGHVVPLGLWKITPTCERALDIYEGVSSKLYRKEYIPFELKDGKVENALVYLMNERGIMPPSEGYVRTIMQGYEDFGVADDEPLVNALQHAWDGKTVTPRIRRRFHERGLKPAKFESVFPAT